MFAAAADDQRTEEGKESVGRDHLVGATGSRGQQQWQQSAAEKGVCGGGGGRRCSRDRDDRR